ncbi:aminotransferase class IV [Demequina sp. SYSU T00192]|uniref:Aminotransferase class IV n=1 Tax=Demequina litoralis TaxID=3051660 RepID=A0ABT8G9C2_9MICO|nr:aminotransferase class IV [Demequina sp. SYSU T00192]MDN4475740.1 aminotransferase class IV [Demequina sp. SYSU T00192]
MPTLVVCAAPVAGMPGCRAELVDPDAPIATATDAGLTRGDGVFETVGVHDGRMHDLEPHLERLAQSASMLDLPAPDLGAMRDAIALAVRSLLESLPATPPTALAKVVYTRGPEHGPQAGRPTGYVYADVFPDVTRQRTEGVAVVTLTRGYPHAIGAKAPWLLVGAKTLSYAVNMAAERHVKALGLDDAILTSTDGYVLEAPRATVLVRLGDEIVTPAAEGGLLHGTAQRAAFESFTARGFACSYRDLTVAELEAADHVWLTDSVQLLRPIRELDGRMLVVDRGLTDGVNADLLAAG